MCLNKIVSTSLVFLCVLGLPSLAHQWKDINSYTYVDIQDYSITYWQKVINIDNMFSFKQMNTLPEAAKEILKNKKIAYLILDSKIECPSGKVTLSQVFYVDRNDNDLLQVVFGEAPYFKVFTTSNGSGIKLEMNKPMPNPQRIYNLNDSNITYCNYLLDKLKD